MQNPLKLITRLSLNIGADPSQSVDDGLRRQTLVIISMVIGIAGIVWGAMYLFLGQTISALFPFSYSLLIGVTIFLFHVTKNYNRFLFSQLFLTLWIPTLLQWSLGGFAASGAVMIWSFLAPMGSIMFAGFKKSIAWFLAYLVLLIVMTYFDRDLAKHGEDIHEGTRLMFFLMNITVVSAITFSSLMYFVSEQLRQKALNLELLEITRKDKQKIEDQHSLLSSSHQALQEEQDKTQTMLQKIETLFGQQVSEEVVKELIAQKEDVKGKSYYVTVLFLDIRDFTNIADSRPAEEVATFQNIVFSELIEIVRRNNGIINQILGDGIMAVFGAPVESQSHTSDAVSSGYAIIGKINELQENNRIPPISVGIGLHCGKVVAGNIGNNFRKQYSLTGNTVIIASRIEQLNKVYKSQFLVSEEVYKKIRNNGFPVTPLGPVGLKGIEQAVGVYQLV